MGIPGVVFWAAGLGLAVCMAAVVWRGAQPSLQRRWVAHQDTDDAVAAYLARIEQGMSPEEAWGLLPRRFRDASADAAWVRYLVARAAGAGHGDALAEVSPSHRSSVAARVVRDQPGRAGRPRLGSGPPGS